MADEFEVEPLQPAFMDLVLVVDLVIEDSPPTVGVSDILEPLTGLPEEPPGVLWGSQLRTTQEPDGATVFDESRHHTEHTYRFAVELDGIGVGPRAPKALH